VHRPTLADGHALASRSGDDWPIFHHHCKSRRQPGHGASAKAKVEEEHGEANITPAFRGLVYIVFEELPLDEFGNRVPPTTAEVAWAGAADAVANTATINSSYQPDHFSVDPTHNRGFVRTGIRLLPWVLYGKALARPGAEDARSRASRRRASSPAPTSSDPFGCVAEACDARGP
jgi:hypothetical protein